MTVGVNQRLQAWVRLAVAGLTPRSCALLLRRFGDPIAVVRATRAELTSIDGVTEEAAERLTSDRSRQRTEEVLRRSAELRLTVATPDDQLYPARLRQLPDPPPALWWRGDRAIVDRPAVAVVGSRHPSSYGRSVADRLSRGLARAGLTVISGMARGIDGVAHAAALEAGGDTIAVLGCGLDRCYPLEHRALQEAVERRGVVLTEFPVGSPPSAHHFPQRNRLISAVALGVVVVEAGERSGSLITARLALELGREVFAVPGNLGSSGSVGTNRLIKSGAALLEGLDDILEGVASQWEGRPLRDGAAKPSACPPEAAVSDPLTPDEENLVQHISCQPCHLDELAARCRQPVQQLAARLLAMELKGAVRQLPGNFYVKTG